MRCTVVGAGVSGLSCAIRLLESGYQVEVVSDKFSPDTVSDVAAAIWYPFLTAPADRADGWVWRPMQNYRGSLMKYLRQESRCEMVEST